MCDSRRSSYYCCAQQVLSWDVLLKTRAHPEPFCLCLLQRGLCKNGVSSILEACNNRHRPMTNFSTCGCLWGVVDGTCSLQCHYKAAIAQWCFGLQGCTTVTFLLWKEEEKHLKATSWRKIKFFLRSYQKDVITKVMETNFPSKVFVHPAICLVILFFNVVYLSSQ